MISEAADVLIDQYGICQQGARMHVNYLLL